MENLYILPNDSAQQTVQLRHRSPTTDTGRILIGGVVRRRAFVFRIENQAMVRRMTP